MTSYVLKSGNLYLSKTGGLTNDRFEALLVDMDTYDAVNGLPGYALRFVRCVERLSIDDAAYQRFMKTWTDRS